MEGWEGSQAPATQQGQQGALLYTALGFLGTAHTDPLASAHPASRACAYSQTQDL